MCPVEITTLRNNDISGIWCAKLTLIYYFIIVNHLFPSTGIQPSDAVSSSSTPVQGVKPNLFDFKSSTSAQGASAVTPGGFFMGGK